MYIHKHIHTHIYYVVSPMCPLVLSMYTHIHACIDIYTYTHILRHPTYVSPRPIFIYTHIYIYTYTHTLWRLAHVPPRPIYIYTHIYVYRYIHTHIYYIMSSMCPFVQYIYTHIYTYSDIYTHTYMTSSLYVYRSLS